MPADIEKEQSPPDKEADFCGGVIGGDTRVVDGLLEVFLSMRGKMYMDAKENYEDLKLNIFQNGIIVFCVDIIAIFLSAYGCYYFYIKSLKDNLKNFIKGIQINYVDVKSLDVIVNSIDTLDYDTIYFILVYTFIPYICFSLVLILIFHLNWSFAVNLPCAIEFRHALGIHGTVNGISFLREMKINLYVSSKAVNKIEKCVKARKFLMLVF